MFPEGDQTLRALLSNPKTGWRLPGLSEVAGVSLGLVARVKSLLADGEWTTGGQTSLSLLDPTARL